MKRLIGIVIALALWLVSVPVAEAITITLAEVQNGAAVVQGNKAAKKATVSWETNNVGLTSNGGSFSFSGIVPADCVGQLSIGAETIDVTLANCAKPTPALAPVPQTGQAATFTAGDDGAIRAGVALPSPRFTDTSDGTITDNLIKQRPTRRIGHGRVFNYFEHQGVPSLTSAPTPVLIRTARTSDHPREGALLHVTRPRAIRRF